MVTKTIFRKITALEEKLRESIKQFHDQEPDIVKVAEKCLIIIDSITRQVKNLVSNHIFEDIGEEVYFFKHMKPVFISKFIYYSSILELESRLPHAGKKTLKKFYENEQEKLKSFYEQHSEFYSYYRRDATYLDHKIFVRNSYDLKMKLSSGFYNFDLSFTTSHDHLISHFIATQDYEQYLKKQIASISEEAGNQPLSPLVWSGSKSGLVELVYGLYQMRCFNGGNIELSEVIKFVEKSLSLDLGNFHKTIFEIRNRKQGPTKFLQMVNDNLIQHFNNMDDFR
ncbi:RteC protein [Chryseobacterium sp. Leaf404]|uniref:RteC domain-containing protein n=1 Tax=unclassified Chryseobacterium TaxID=2593645 RepID=UPI0006FB74C8|nr:MULTISPECIES: RteC domain-containing protein [unclassified Chryseobacterium]KQT15131.1 RteC protein [Chryseobacterium sp. Leaf404]